MPRQTNACRFSSRDNNNIMPLQPPSLPPCPHHNYAPCTPHKVVVDREDQHAHVVLGAVVRHLVKSCSKHCRFLDLLHNVLDDDLEDIRTSGWVGWIFACTTILGCCAQSINTVCTMLPVSEVPCIYCYHHMLALLPTWP